ncbi:MAG: hypothetical protein K0R57_1542 [Paenibacillaceae bacterium]|jgi:hypothetical protein|nr:hypothetical protein [Paenibacillaceae bacterium]
MNEEEIRELEPKYTGNTRHLTEGEAAEIIHDPANHEDDTDQIFTNTALAALFFTERNNNGNAP